jgi:hypothetical protein
MYNGLGRNPFTLAYGLALGAVADFGDVSFVIGTKLIKRTNFQKPLRSPP